jgi:hypothetical protein
VFSQVRQQRVDLTVTSYVQGSDEIGHVEFDHPVNRTTQ